jgi:acid stress chaperone HdeA
MKRWKAVGMACLMTAMLASGCSTNQGGDTKCKDFNSQDDQKQHAAVAKMLKDEKGTDASELEISANLLSAQTFCKTLAKEDSRIKESVHT